MFLLFVRFNFAFFLLLKKGVVFLNLVSVVHIFLILYIREADFFLFLDNKITKKRKHGASGGKRFFRYLEKKFSSKLKIGVVFLNLVSVVHIFLFLYIREALFFYFWTTKLQKRESMEPPAVKGFLGTL